MRSLNASCDSEESLLPSTPPAVPLASSEAALEGATLREEPRLESLLGTASGDVRGDGLDFPLLLGPACACCRPALAGGLVIVTGCAAALAWFGAFSGELGGPGEWRAP